MWLKWKAEHNKLYEYYYRDICDFDGDNGDTEVVPATIVDELSVVLFILASFGMGAGFLKQFMGLKGWGQSGFVVIGVLDSIDIMFEEYHKTNGFVGSKSERLLMVNCHRHLGRDTGAWANPPEGLPGYQGRGWSLYGWVRGVRIKKLDEC